MARVWTKKPFIITGTGVAVGFFYLFMEPSTGQQPPNERFNFRIRRLMIRQNAAGGATLAKFYISQGVNAYSDPDNITEEDLVLRTAIITPTPSATVAFLKSKIDQQPLVVDAARVWAKVTAGAGAWTFTGLVELDMDS